MNPFKFFICFLGWMLIFALATEGQQEKGFLTFSGYVEAYYSYDFNRPDNHEKPPFLYNFKRHNEFSLNLAMLKMGYDDGKVRSNMALMVGDYARYNLGDEPTWAQFIYEASVGVQLMDKLWLDMGVMPSHIGFESAIGMDCWHMTRSLLAENSPYFLTGARFTYSHTANFDLILWLTNGWQNVQRTHRNQALGIGVGLNYRPMEGMEFNYANYFGNEYPQTLNIYRYFNNFYFQYSWQSWGITLGTDYGVEQKLFSPTFNHWYGLTFSLRKELTEKFHAALRAEHYSDQKRVILDSGMRLSGFSLNLDYHFTEKALMRFEARQFQSPEAVFEIPAGKLSKGNTSFSTSLAVRF